MPSDSPFARRLTATAPPQGDRRWLYLPYDQLGHHLGPLATEDPRHLGVVLVEHPAKAARRPYHQQKLAWVLANGRQFALELQARGVAVHHCVARTPLLRDTLRPLAATLGPLGVMTPAERELRADLAPLLAEGALVALDHPGWLSTAADFEAGAGPTPPWRMDRFYRHVRRRTGLLMDTHGKPLGGKFSFDAENRKAWRGEPPAPLPPTFAPDPVTAEVLDLIRARYAHHPGRLVPEALPSTRADAETLWTWAKAACLPQFGPYEDAISRSSRSLFHTRLSPLLNLQRLSAERVVHEAAALALPLNSKEGFVRQILGWREFVRHVHLRTDGFRALPGVETRPHPGDGGFAGWAKAPWPTGEPPPEIDGGAAPHALVGDAPLPPAWWGTESGLACLDHVVAEVWAEGYTHHIPRLMVLANLATLLGVDPRALTDWFWVAFTDAYDWVVEPNVLGMGSFAVGEVMTTKPYVSGAAYIHKLSDLCAGCAFDPQGDCPVTPLYWRFLARNAAALAGNPRLSLPLASARKRPAARQARDARIADWVSARLQAGARLNPAELAARIDAEPTP